MRAPSARGRGRGSALALLLVALLLAVAWAPAPRAGCGQATSDIVVTQLHIFITKSAGGLGIGEYYLLSNTGEQTYEGVEDPQTGERVTARFALPEGAQGLRFDGPGLGERFVEVEEGFADTEPIPPGTATVGVLFTYEMPYREGMQVARAFAVPVMSVVLVIAEEGLALAGDGVTSAGVLDTQMGPALSYTAGPLAAGESLVFSVITGMESAPAAPVTSTPARNTVREAAIGLLALAVAVSVVYLLWRLPGPGPIPGRARRGVEIIARLDSDFEAGRVTESKYRRDRAMYKRQLRVILGEVGYQDDD